MSKHNRFNTLDDLREHALSALQRLENKEIDPIEAGVIGKLCENVVSTIKTQMEYARMVGRQPKIEFIGNCEGKILPASPRRLLNHKKDK